MDSLEEKHLEAEDELNMEARPGLQFLTGTGFLRKCPLRLGEFSDGLACACFHMGISFFVSGAAPAMSRYSAANPEMPWVMADTTLVKPSTG